VPMVTLQQTSNIGLSSPTSAATTLRHSVRPQTDRARPLRCRGRFGCPPVDQSQMQARSAVWITPFRSATRVALRAFWVANEVIEAGQSQFVDDGYTLDDMLTVEATPGHTAGHVMIRAKGAGAGGATGLFTGDIMHNPIQVPYPDINSGFCQDPAVARTVRRRVLDEAAEHNHLLLPAHFGPPHVGRVRRDGNAFAFISG